MFLTESPIELTTGATDAMLAIESIVIMLGLRRTAPAGHFRTSLWCWVFGLLALSAYPVLLLAFGFFLPEEKQKACVLFGRTPVCLYKE